MAPIILTANFFGVLPVSGVFKGVTHVKFQQYSIKVLIFVFNVVFSCAEIILTGLKVTGLTFNKIGAFMFYIVTTIEAVLFYQLAKRYGDLIRNWQEKEEVFLTDPYFVSGKRLKFKIRMVAYFMFILFIGMM